MTSKRVTLIIDRFGSGGAQTQMSLLCRGLLSNGCEVSIITYHPNDLERHRDYLNGADLVQASKTHRLDLTPAFAIAKALRDTRPDAVISFLATPNIFAALASLVTNFQGSLVLGERVSFPSGHASPRQYLERVAFYRATSVVTNSHAQRLALERTFPSLASRIVTIWNAVDLQRFAPPQTPPRPDAPIIGVGRVVPDKNILGLIRALSLIRREHPEICIVWAGRVHDNLYHQLCINELNSLGLSSHWQWAGERLDIEALYQHARLLVLPSFHEGLPNVAAEALASGLPCALSNVADAPRIIDNGRNGALFDPCDVSDIAQAILRLIARQAERQGFVMRNAARVYAERHFGEEAMVSAYLRLL